MLWHIAEVVFACNVVGKMLIGAVLIQHLLRRCKQVEISIWLGSLESASTLFISWLTMSKSLARIMMINSKSFWTWYRFCLLTCNPAIWLENYSVFRYVWESKADGAFAISEDTWNEPLGRGTEIRLHLKEEAGEYLQESKLKVCTKLFTLIIISFSSLKFHVF